MRYALIDNSTLTGVQRLTGQIPVQNTIFSEMDILCMESLLQAILFYDRLVLIDDYKPQHRQGRRDAFPEILPLEPSHIDYDDLLSAAKAATEDIVPRVEGGQITDGDFRPFFDLLRMNVTFTWDMSSSIYYLTQKMLAGVGGLDLEKYSRLSSSIYNELLVKSRNTAPTDQDDKFMLVDRKGKAITPDYKVIDKGGKEQEARISRQASAFFAGLNWLAFRAIFYTIAANSMEIDLYLHPIRQGFQVNYLMKIHREDPSQFRPLIDAMNNSANDALNRILVGSRPFFTEQQVPLFVAWFAKEVGNTVSFIDAAYQIRSEEPFVSARQQLIQLEDLQREERLEERLDLANRMILDVGKITSSIVVKYGASTEQGIPVSSLITAWNLGSTFLGLPKLPQLGTRIRQLEFLKHLVPQKGFKAIYRALVSDLSTVARLGQIYEILTANVVLEEDAREYLDKTEDHRYRNSKSYWKIPM